MVTFTNNSPRNSGEKAATSKWVEIDYNQFKHLTYKQRVNFAFNIAQKYNTDVHYKKSNIHGHARIFYQLWG